MYVFDLLLNIINYTINTVINFFFYKHIKYYITNKSTYKLNTLIYNTRILFTINYIIIANILSNICKLIKFTNINISIFPYKKNSPFWLIIINNVHLTLNNTINLSTINKTYIDNNVTNSNNINYGFKKIEELLFLITKHQKYIIKNININIDCFTIFINNITIIRKNNTDSVYIQYVTVRTTDNICLKLKDIYIEFEKYTLSIFNIKHIIVLLYKNAILPIDTLTNIKFISTNKECNIKLNISKIDIKLIHNNYYCMSLHTNVIEYPYYIQSKNFMILSYTKVILLGNYIKYDLKQKNIELIKLVFNIYSSFGHKIYKTLCKYTKSNNKTLKKTEIKYEPISNNIILNNYIHSQRHKKKNKIHSILNKTHSNINVKYQYLNKSNIDKILNLHINNICVNFINNNNKLLEWEFTNINLTYNKGNNMDLLFENIKIYDGKDIILNKLYNNDNHTVTYVNGTLNIMLKPIYLNIKPILFNKIKRILTNNGNFIQKLVNTNSIDETFYIHYLHLNSFKIIIDYYPNNYNYKNLLIGSFGEIYNILNYKNVNIITKEIVLFYPYDLNTACKKILNEWLTDIYKNQLNSIISSTKLSYTSGYFKKNYKKYIASMFEKMLLFISKLLVDT